MDVLEYLNQKATLEEYDGYDKEYRVDKYKQPIQINVRIEGGTKIIRKADNSLYQSDKWYWIGKKIKAKSKINGQLIQATKEFYDFDGSFIYLEAYV